VQEPEREDHTLPKYQSVGRVDVRRQKGDVLPISEHISNGLEMAPEVPSSIVMSFLADLSATYRKSFETESLFGNLAMFRRSGLSAKVFAARLGFVGRDISGRGEAGGDIYWHAGYWFFGCHLPVDRQARAVHVVGRVGACGLPGSAWVGGPWK
jgi:hypothetical protein